MTNKPNSQSTPAQKSKQNSIYIGLQSVLTEVEAIEVIEKWSTYFNETGSVFNGLNSFVKEVCQSYGIANQQRNLLRALHRALLNSENDTSMNEVKGNVPGKPPIELTNTLDKSDMPTPIIDQAINTPDFQTFQSLILNILGLLKESEGQISPKLNSFSIELIQSMPWSEGQQNQLLSLISTGKTIQLRTYMPDQLKTFLNHFRSWLEDEIGNVQAAWVINQAVASVKTRPENITYSVEKFL